MISLSNKARAFFSHSINYQIRIKSEYASNCHLKIDIFKWHPLLRAAKNPSVELVTFKDSIRDKGLGIEKSVS